MGKIIDARGDEALDVLAELLEPVGEIAGDAEISGMMRSGGKATVMELVRAMLKGHKDAVVKIMAIDDGKTVEEERGMISALTIPARLLKILSVPSVKDLLFGSAETSVPANGSSAASGSGNG